MTAPVAKHVRVLSSVPVGGCTFITHSVPDPVHADGALCPVELGVVDVGSLAGSDATPLLLDWAFVPNDTFVIVGDRDDSEDCQDGENGEEQMRLP
jgi:hypothetical protein